MSDYETCNKESCDDSVKPGYSYCDYHCAANWGRKHANNAARSVMDDE